MRKFSSLFKKFSLLLLAFPVVAFAGQQQVHSYTLKNGLKIFVKVNQNAPVVVTQLWYRVGSSYEPNGITGISHLLEHLMFSGTKRFPEGELTRLIRANGGEQNALTSRDYTMYFQELPADKLALSFELEADRMVNLNLTYKNFKKELAIVKEEKRLRIDNNPQANAITRFYSLAFIASPYHHPVIGWDDDLLQMPFEAVKQWYKRWYAPNNATLVVVGDVNPERVYQLAQHYFGAIPASKLPHLTRPAEAQPFGKRQLTLHLQAKLPLLVMGYNVPTYRTLADKQKIAALYVAAALLGGGPSSRLPSALVRQQELAVTVDASYTPIQRLSGEFELFGIPAPGVSLRQLQHAILQQVRSLKTTLPSKEELQRVKAQVVAGQVYQQDSLFLQAKRLGLLATLNLPWQTYQHFLQEVKQVTPQQVQAVAKQYFNSDRLTIMKMIPDESKK